MNKFLSLSKIFFSLALAAVMFSCDEDNDTVDPMVDTGDSTSTEVNAPDGVYLFGSASVEDFSAFYIMTDGVVEGDGFAATPRTGFLATYVYLNQGSFVFASVTDNVRTDFGGAVEVVDLAGADDQINAEVMQGAWTEGGEAITIANEGLHQVIIDEQTGTFMISPVISWGIIGNATPESWGADTDFEITSEANAEKVVYQATGINMIEGEWKIRYNDGWKIIQDTVDNVAGYVAFTNYGGSASALLPGGGNVAFSDADKGVYDLTFTWDAITGFSIEFDRTGDIAETPFDPATDLPWGIIGAATNEDADAGWASDTDLAISENGSTITWSITTSLIAGREFKFRSDDNWTRELNFDSFTAVTGDAANLISAANNNILLSGDAEATDSYEIIIVSTDEGTTHTLEFNLAQ